MSPHSDLSVESFHTETIHKMKKKKIIARSSWIYWRNKYPLASLYKGLRFWSLTFGFLKVKNISKFQIRHLRKSINLKFKTKKLISSHLPHYSFLIQECIDFYFPIIESLTFTKTVSLHVILKDTIQELKLNQLLLRVWWCDEKILPEMTISNTPKYAKPSIFTPMGASSMFPVMSILASISCCQWSKPLLTRISAKHSRVSS